MPRELSAMPSNALLLERMEGVNQVGDADLQLAEAGVRPTRPDVDRWLLNTTLDVMAQLLWGCAGPLPERDVEARR